MCRYHSIVTPVHPSMESYGIDVALNSRPTCSYFANLEIFGCLSFVSKGLEDAAKSRWELCRNIAIYAIYAPYIWAVLWVAD